MKKYSALLLLCLMACEFGQKNRQLPPDAEPPALQGTFVEYEIREIDQRGGPCEIDTTSTRCIDFDISYPAILKGAPAQVLDIMNTNIQKGILEYAFEGGKTQDFRSLIGEIKSEYETVIQDFPEYNTAWQLEIKSDIIFQDSLYVSVASTIYTYTGGAHANTFQVYRSYDLQTGEVIGLADILEAGYELDLNEAAELEFRMAKQIPPSRDLDDEGYFFNGNRFQLNENFAILNKSLLFYFNPYEIAPYALGGTLLELKLTDYVKLIKDGSVIEDLKN